MACAKAVQCKPPMRNSRSGFVIPRESGSRRRDFHALKHFVDGSDLVNDFAGKDRRLPDEQIPRLQALKEPCVMRERCRLRRLRVL